MKGEDFGCVKVDTFRVAALSGKSFFMAAGFRPSRFLSHDGHHTAFWLNPGALVRAEPAQNL